MCGIYGTTKNYNDTTIKEKLNRTKFRGPDAQSYKYINDKLILGHNRLSIIDLDSRSNQPFSYCHIHIVFNGEIYNFLEIKNSLIEKGFSFTTTSDTEVLCAAYLLHGKDFVKILNGMFSFLIYDERDEILFAAIDRIGKKPFYYSNDFSGFEFASQPIMISIGNSLDISNDAVNEFLLRGYISAPLSIYLDVNKLQPGHTLTYELNTKSISIEKYWDISNVGLNTFKGSYNEAEEQLSHLLKDSVSMRMISDVPFGTFLSGGVDSSLITAIAQKISSKPINTFSIQFEENEFDESKHAEKIANYLGTDHNTILCSINEGISLIKDHNYFFDEPFADSSALPTMLLAKHTKEFVTVALSGDGGDESFLGYTRYDWINILGLLYKMPTFLRITVGKILSKHPNFRYKILGLKLQNDKCIEELVYNFLQSNYSQILIEKMKINSDLYNYTFLSNNIVQKAADLDLKLWLTGDGLVKIDRANMAYSVEARAPLLDYRIIEFARSLPIDYKYEYGNKKRILKDILAKYVPEEIFKKPKSGFSVPMALWFKNELKEMVYDTLTEKNLNLIPNLNVPYVRKGIKDHMSNKINFSPEIWRLVVLVNWMHENGKA